MTVAAVAFGSSNFEKDFPTHQTPSASRTRTRWPCRLARGGLTHPSGLRISLSAATIRGTKDWPRSDWY